MMSENIDIITITESNTFIYSGVHAVVQVFFEMIVVKTEMGSPWYPSLTLENELVLDITVPTKLANTFKCEDNDDDYQLNISSMV